MPTVIGGKLKLKGAKKSSTSGNKKGVSAKVGLKEADAEGRREKDIAEGGDEKKASKEKEVFLTETQRKHKAKMDDILKNKIAKKMSETSYRERVEAFNHKLATTTEHNDIPRVSAAGNG
jgi:protein FAM32A